MKRNQYHNFEEVKGLEEIQNRVEMYNLFRKVVQKMRQEKTRV